MPRPADPYPVNAEPQKRVAVIGSGIAGLTAAHLLSRRYHVTLIEREEVLGMDAHSKTSHNARMDIPLRVFSESYYPNLCRLYRSIGVAFGTADYSFSLVDDCRGGGAYFRYVNLLVRGLALPLPSPTLLLAPQRLPRYLRLAYQFGRFLRSSPAQVALPGMGDLCLEDFLAANGYAQAFGPDLLYPMLSVVCTCSYASVRTYPAALIVDYFAGKYGLSGAQCRAHEGTREAVAKLAQPVARRVTGATVREVRPSQAGGRPHVEWSSGGGADGATSHREAFDEVVVATQVSAARRLLRPAAEASEGADRDVYDALGSFRCERFRVLLHTDASLMPARRRDWSPLNLVVSPTGSAASVTVWMNAIDEKLRQSLSAPVFQTWNPVTEPRPEAVEADVAFERPIVDPAAVRAMGKLARCQGRGSLWLVGSYVRCSMPLLENGVTSAIEVAKRLGVDVSDIEYVESRQAKPQPAGGRLVWWAVAAALAVAAVLAAASR